jgi:hypothetical protein
MTVAEPKRMSVSRVKRCPQHPGRCALGLVPIAASHTDLAGPWHFGWDPHDERWIVISPRDLVRSVLVLDGHDRLKALRDLVPELQLAGGDDGLAIAQLSGAFTR